ncbi:MAG: hypothetical protein O7A69_11330 [SAR324 cluster bacterium]|nr:hypothetical protein [SAR324 cluster bacterium]
MTETTQKKGLSPFTRQVSELVGGPGITIARGSSIAEAAKLMAEQGVGSLVVLEGSEPVGMNQNGYGAARVGGQYGYRTKS